MNFIVLDQKLIQLQNLLLKNLQVSGNCYICKGYKKEENKGTRMSNLEIILNNYKLSVKIKYSFLSE